MQRIIGTAWCYGDNINTDLIYPGRYLTITKPNEMAKHALADLDAEFSQKVQPGDMIVAGENFGNGSSREQAAMCLKYAGVSTIIARTFARIFYRNAINQGIPAIISPEVVEVIKTGDKVELDLAEHTLNHQTTGKRYSIEPIPDFLLEIIADGGIIPHLKKKFN
ncbi:MAG: 3-isopropylmalate dehydratase small subunit [Thermoplasmata archaeon]|nr:3-isopropylmalate dehydratase small subunit [Thermoplasmata archaeon]